MMAMDQMNSNPQAAEETARLSSAFMVLLDQEGLRLPGLDTISGRAKFPPLSLDFAAVTYLLHIAGGAQAECANRIAEECGGSAEALEALREELKVRGLMVAGTPPSHAPLAATGETVRQGTQVRLERRLIFERPRLFRNQAGAFEALDHDGRLLVRLTPAELDALARYTAPCSVAQAHEAHVVACSGAALSSSAFAELSAQFVAVGLLVPYDTDFETEPNHRRRGGPTFGRERAARRDWERFQHLNEAMRALSDAFEERENGSRTTVYCVHQNGTIPPLALGMIAEYAEAFENGVLKDHYAFHPDMLIRPSKIRRMAKAPGVYLFSNYNWSHSANLRISRRVKQMSPHSLTVHGGPNSPKYRAEAEAYLSNNPDVDVIVRGEGEQTSAELLKAMIGRITADAPPDLSALAGIAGLAYRNGDSMVMTEDRARIDDLDAIPSPILSGRFAPYRGTELGIIETNRGCPYSCTFCDWGSAIGTRIRKFSMDRTFAELEWFSTHEFAGLMCADANFGIFPRDVEIARKVAELKETYGYPRAFSVSFAKNSTKYTREIIEIFSNAGIISKGNIAVQTMDEATLKAIRRSNIKLDKYDELTDEFRSLGLPLWVDLMFGLPGQTIESFQNDLQECIDRGVFPRIFMTELLPNSPMNDPDYKREFAIETETSPDGFKNLVVACSTFSRADFEYMNRLRLMFVLSDVIGMLRHVAHYARAEIGLREIQVYARLVAAIERNPETYPTLAFSVRAIPGLLIPPASWACVLDEARRFLVTELGVRDDAALDTMLRVQLAILPSPNRPMPETIDLGHDYAAWHQKMIAAALGGHRTDWETVVPPLRDMPPGRFVVEDPDHICEFGIGSAEDGDLYGNFELRSPVARWTPPDPTYGARYQAIPASSRSGSSASAAATAK
jgi:radical SAM superfamily enzyme YgiQ (UPF0313 family)